MKKALLFILCFALTTACSRQSAQLQFNQQTLKKMRGSSQEEVYKQLGTPKQTLKKDGKTYLIYNTVYQNFIVPTSQTYNNPGSITQTGTYIPQTCTTIFTIVLGVVESVDTNGDCLW